MGQKTRDWARARNKNRNPTVERAGSAVATSESPNPADIYEENQSKIDIFTIEGQDRLVFQDIESTATAANLAGDNGSVLAMEGGGFSFGDGLNGEIPRSLDDLVNLLDIKAPSGTAGSPDIQHFSAFASQDMWPI